LQDFPRHALAGQRTGLRFALGQAVEVRLAEAVPRTGGLVFHLMQGLPPKPRGARRR
jgi:ribonuclease R